MNISSFNPIVWFRKLRPSGVARPRSALPARDWLYILGVGTLAALALVAVSAYLFIDIQRNPAAAGVGTAAEGVQLNRTELAGVVERYRERTVRFETIRREPEPVPSPGTVRGAASADNDRAATTSNVRTEPPSAQERIVPTQ